jgi:hypothetical protein
MAVFVVPVPEMLHDFDVVVDGIVVVVVVLDYLYLRMSCWRVSAIVGEWFLGEPIPEVWACCHAYFWSLRSGGRSQPWLIVSYPDFFTLSIACGEGCRLKV